MSEPHQEGAASRDDARGRGDGPKPGETEIDSVYGLNERVLRWLAAELVASGYRNGIFLDVMGPRLPTRPFTEAEREAWTREVKDLWRPRP